MFSSVEQTVKEKQISLENGKGRYVSLNSRDGFWGTGAIEQISNMLQKELPGLRGFSASNIKNMRIFYNEWSFVINRQLSTDDLQNGEYNNNITNRSLMMSDFEKKDYQSPLQNRQLITDDLQVNENLLLLQIRQPTANEFEWEDFFQLGFTHHMEIIFKTKSLDMRIFYVRECAKNFWSVITLKNYLRADLYNKRGTMPNNFTQAIPDKIQALKAVIAFKDEYLLDYINVEQLGEREKDLDERVLEQGIVANIKKFIMTFGHDFSFVGNQYRVEVAGEELFIDLLFFNRELNALVAVELKSGKFRSSYLGQLNTYLAALDQYVRKPHENPSIGIILCKEMNHTFVQFAVRDYTKPMGVATYRTAEEMPENWRKVLPDIDELKKLL
ncbi:MAG: PDDEXK nuclease domain-containing protein [Prevotellaceae bacterium]|nr:PDDEXK nuclease domain-containing protein [Prevotellaceae bacterium]